MWYIWIHAVQLKIYAHSSHYIVFCYGWYTHPPMHKMAAISQTIFPDAFSWMKTTFWLKFHWSLFVRVQLIMTRHWFQIMAWRRISPCGCGDLSVRLGSRISPHRYRVVVEVYWRGAQGWRSILRSFNLSMAATGDVWIIPSFRIWGYVLHVEHISCVITNCGQLQWVIPSLFSIALLALLEKNITRKLLSLSLDLFFKILLFQVIFLIFFSTAIFSPYFLQVCLLLQYVALFQ